MARALVALWAFAWFALPARAETQTWGERESVRLVETAVATLLNNLDPYNRGNFPTKGSRKPVVAVYQIRNETKIRIDTKALIRRLEQRIKGLPQVTFKAMKIGKDGFRRLDAEADVNLSVDVYYSRPPYVNFGYETCQVTLHTRLFSVAFKENRGGATLGGVFCTPMPQQAAAPSASLPTKRAFLHLAPEGGRAATEGMVYGLGFALRPGRWVDLRTTILASERLSLTEEAKRDPAFDTPGELESFKTSGGHFVFRPSLVPLEWMFVSAGFGWQWVRAETTRTAPVADPGPRGAPPEGEEETVRKDFYLPHLNAGVGVRIHFLPLFVGLSAEFVSHGPFRDKEAQGIKKFVVERRARDRMLGLLSFGLAF